MAELCCLVWSPRTWIPWKDGLNVDPFLFFDVPIHMDLCPSLFYLHLRGWNVKRYQGKSEYQSVYMIGSPSILNEMNGESEFKQAWVLFLLLSLPLLFFFFYKETRMKSTIDNFSRFLPAPINARMNCCLKPLNNSPLPVGWNISPTKRKGNPPTLLVGM